MQNRRGIKQILILAAVFCLAWVAFRWLMPVILPFLAGLGVAALAEPAVKRLTGRHRLPRALAAGLCVAGIYLLLGSFVYLLCLVAYRELGKLAGSLPQMAQSLASPLAKVKDWAYALADRAPGDLRPMLESAVSSMFEGTSALAARAGTGILNFLSSAISHLPDGLLFLGTAVLSSFMISAQFPRLKERFRPRLPEKWREKLLPMASNIRHATGGWFRAQAKLMGVTFLIITAGLFVLRVEFPVLFGGLIALVDALPMLGTGTVLIPWGLLRFLEGDPAMGVGLLALYGVALTTRTALEPRLVGKHMGLNPLLTLAAIYAGFRLWGVLGMLVAPILTITAQQIYGLTRPAKN